MHWIYVSYALSHWYHSVSICWFVLCWCLPTFVCSNVCLCLFCRRSRACLVSVQVGVLFVLSMAPFDWHVHAACMLTKGKGSGFNSGISYHMKCWGILWNLVGQFVLIQLNSISSDTWNVSWNHWWLNEISKKTSNCSAVTTDGITWLDRICAGTVMIKLWSYMHMAPTLKG